MAKLKEIVSIAMGTIFLLVVFNFLILFASLTQIVTEERTGYWSPYWRWQAEAVISLIQGIRPNN